MSREERERMTIQNDKRKKANDKVAEKIQKCGLFPTKSRIRKYRLWEEAGRQCLYCGRSIDEKQCLNGDDMEVEHIIPKSVLYDDSYGNKTCACRRCNKEKGNRTALEYIRAKGWEDEYMERINERLKAKKISYSKYQRLRWLKEDIPSRLPRAPAASDTVYLAPSYGHPPAGYPPCLCERRWSDCPTS